MKFNKKQKTLLKIYAFIIFSVVLVMFLNYFFNTRANKKYVGTWTIGYKFYKKGTNDLTYTFTQTLRINKDGSFSTEEKTEPQKSVKSSVTGTYKVKDNKITLDYNQYKKEKQNELYYQDGKLCTNLNCTRYYTKDSKTVYFDIKQES